MLLPSLSIPALAELARTPAWVCWRFCVHRRTGKPSKVPFTPAGSKAKSTETRSWSSYAECFEATFVEGRHDGIGRVVVEGEGFVAVDLDDCCASDGSIEPWANQVVTALASYTELSPSGTGLHIWCHSSWPTFGNRRGKLEVYASRRFITVTGRHLAGTPEDIRPCGPALEELWRERFETKHAQRGNGADLPHIDLPLPMDPLLVQSLAKTYPQLRRILEGHYESASERDLAIVRFAKIARWEREAAWALVRAVRGDNKSARSDYAARTLARVY